MLEREQLIDYIVKHKNDMSAREMSRATGETINRIYGIGYSLHIRFIKRRTQRPSVDFCRDRPESCYKCPLPECVCNERLTENEAAYLFAGIGKDENKIREKLERMNEGKE